VKWSRWLTWLGVAVALFGVVVGVWLQVATVWPRGVGGGTNYRLQNAVEAVSTVVFGALLAVAAQIMGMMQAARDQAANRLTT